MPNLYATLAEVRSVAPDALVSSVTGYDPLFIRLASSISRWVDNHCKRVFYPVQDTRYYNGKGAKQLYVGDLFSVTSISFSSDNGQTYTALAATDYMLMLGKDYGPRGSYNKI